MNKKECIVERNIAVLKIVSILVSVFISSVVYFKTSYSLVFCIFLLFISLGIIYLIYREFYKIVVIETILKKNVDDNGISNKVNGYLDKLFKIQND